MRPFLCAVLLLVSAAFAFGDEHAPCQAGQISTVGHVDGVTFQRVSFHEAYGEVAASVFVPDSEVPVPGILFTHSAIQASRKRADLMRFALAVARAGAAAIVLDGTIQWERPNDDSTRAAHVVACAGQWLLQHTNVDSDRIAIAGPTFLGGGDTPLCYLGDKPCFKPCCAITFGRTTEAEWYNTYAFFKRSGQLQFVRFLQHQLHIGEVKPEWLFGEPRQVKTSTTP